MSKLSYKDRELLAKDTHIARLVALLRPFALCADAYDERAPNYKDDDLVYEWRVTKDGKAITRSLTVGHLREARAALSAPADRGGK
jgi:hypothetical protein